MQYRAFSTATDELGIGGVAGSLAGGDGATGAAAAYAGETYNRQLHQEEIKILKDKKVIEEYAEKKGISKEEAEKQLTKAGVAMVDGTWNKKFGGDASFEEASQYLLAQDDDAFREYNKAVYNNFNNSGEVFKTNIDFYGKNLDDVDLFVIEHDKNDPYGAVAYRRNDNEELDKFGKFVTRGINYDEIGGNPQEIAVKEGVYSYSIDLKTSRKGNYNAMILEDGGFVPTLGKNQVQGDRKEANRVYAAHRMDSYAKTLDKVGGEGCWGVPATNADAPKENFFNFNIPFANSPNKTGDVVLIRLEGNSVKK